MSKLTIAGSLNLQFRSRYEHMPKVLALWAALALLIPTPRAFSQMGQHEPRDRARPEQESIEQTERSERPERAEDAFTLPALPPRSLPTSVPSPTLAADELPFGPTSAADFPRWSAPPDAGCEEFLTTGELCVRLEIPPLHDLLARASRILGPAGGAGRVTLLSLL